MIEMYLIDAHVIGFVFEQNSARRIRAKKSINKKMFSAAKKIFKPIGIAISNRSYTMF